MRGLFVTGTDTGAGKTVVAAAICAALSARGEPVTAFKPVVTGLDAPRGVWPPDHELLAAVSGSGQAPEDVSPYRFGPAVSPHWAAELAGVEIDPALLVERARPADGRALVAEGVGGLLVPITSDYLMRDLALDLSLPVVIAARTGLGTINHTLLTLAAARSVGLHPVAVVMTPWPGQPEPIEESNRATIRELGEVPVAALPRCSPGTLAEAGAHLPLDDWLP